MWIRVRRAYAKNTNVTQVVVRLTANSERVKLKAAWAGLAKCTRVPKRLPAKPPKNARDSYDLLVEALIYLTHPMLSSIVGKKRRKSKKPLDVGKPLDVADAIALVKRFEFVADRSQEDIRAAINSTLRSLRSRISSDVLRTWLLGHFFEVAQKSGMIASTRLADALPLVQSIIELSPDLDRLVERVLSGEPAQPRPGRLPQRPWRDAQPSAADAIDAMNTSVNGGFLVLTGEAGLGKSTVLTGIYAELKRDGAKVAWLSLTADGGPPPTPEQLKQLTTILSERCTWERTPCWLLVDGIDGAPDTLNYLVPEQGLLRVVVAVRTENYERRRKLAATQVPLRRWPADQVSEAFGANLPSDLAVLLGNPFLLDLALEIRTYRDPLRRPTRFAVLSRYLSDVVFVRGPRGVDARACFDVMARGLIRGDSWTTPPSAGLQRILDRGVASAPGGGRVQFAHPLFGEIGAALWASHRSGEHCVRRLRQIRDSFLQTSALRILLEGCADVGDSSRLLDLPGLSPLLDAGLDGTVDIVGALAALDIVVPEVLRHPRAAEFAARLFEAAKLQNQTSWLDAVAALEPQLTPSWATAASREDALPSIAEHLAASADSLSPDTRREVALRLRQWSTGQRSLWTSYLVDAVAAELPDEETLRWMNSIMTADAPWVAGWLRRAVRRIASRNRAIDPVLMRETVTRLVAAGQQYERDEFEDAHGLLLAERGEHGLIETQPALALDVLFDWQERETRREREDRKRWRDIYPSAFVEESAVAEEEEDDG